MIRKTLAPGEISEFYSKTKVPNGWRVRSRFCGLDGVTRQCEATGATVKEAYDRMYELAMRRIWPTGVPISASSTLGEVCDQWLQMCANRPDLRDQSVAQYRSGVENHIKPVLGKIRVTEVTVPMMNTIIQSHVSAGRHATAKRVKKYLTMVMQFATENGLIPRNIAKDTVRVSAPPKRPRALTNEEVSTIRMALRTYRSGSGGSFYGPRADGQLAQVVEVMLGCSARPGEILALKWRDVDIDSENPEVFINATMVPGKVERQEMPKGARQTRYVPLPQFAVDALRERRSQASATKPDDYIFQTRNGRPFSTTAMGQRWRRFRSSVEGLADLDFSETKMYAFRKTVATTLARNVNLELARDTLGHSSVQTTEQFYEQHTPRVNPVAAEVLEQQYGAVGSTVTPLVHRDRAQPGGVTKPVRYGTAP